ncbi:MAG TPA: M20/M25/M40 family metallo-hydrolase [Terriglobales bacterium]|nr:M20/M25/M40 family metallo-hydrolase [Terriglobales bacterium]
MRLRFVLVPAVFLLASVTLPAQKAAAPDLAAARDEAVQILAGLVKIDTSNPPGNETKAARHIQEIFDREGIASEIFESAPGRGSIVARLKGNGKKRPLLLMGHLDVVGVERDKWTVDPFGAVIKDGYLYGRGASDDKAMVSACLEIVLLLHRMKAPLDRDVIFLAEAGEEGTSQFGIGYMVKEHWEKIEAEFALNEGGSIHNVDGKVTDVQIGTTEKVPRTTRLVARGSSGHASIPRPDNPVVHLAAAVGKFGEWQPPARLNETTRLFFQRLATISPPDEAALYRNVEDPAVQEKLRLSKPVYYSMLRTSIVPTIVKGGFRTNVIPADAEATLDIRSLPDEDMDALLEKMRQLINDPEIEIVKNNYGARPTSPPSSVNTEMFAALERAQKKVFPAAVTLPAMGTGATDSAQLRAKGVQAYGLGNVSTDDDRRRVHGNDERASVEGLGKFLEFMWLAVTDVALAK